MSKESRLHKVNRAWNGLASWERTIIWLQVAIMVWINRQLRAGQ